MFKASEFFTFKILESQIKKVKKSDHKNDGINKEIDLIWSQVFDLSDGIDLLYYFSIFIGKIILYISP